MTKEKWVGRESWNGEESYKRGEKLGRKHEMKKEEQIEVPSSEKIVGNGQKEYKFIRKVNNQLIY